MMSIQDHMRDGSNPATWSPFPKDKPRFIPLYLQNKPNIVKIPDTHIRKWTRDFYYKNPNIETPDKKDIRTWILKHKDKIMEKSGNGKTKYSISNKYIKQYPEGLVKFKFTGGAIPLQVIGIVAPLVGTLLTGITSAITETIKGRNEQKAAERAAEQALQEQIQPKKRGYGIKKCGGTILPYNRELTKTYNNFTPKF